MHHAGRSYAGRKLHVVEDLRLQIYTGCDFDQFQAGRRQPQHCSFGNVEYFLPALERRRAMEADLGDGSDEFAVFALGDDLQFSIGAGGDDEAGDRERAAENDPFSALGDIDEATDASEAAGELADVDAAFCVDFDGTEDGNIDAAAVVEIELSRLIDDCFGMVGTAEAEAGGGHATDRSGFDGEGEILKSSLFGGDSRDGFGKADTEIDDGAGGNLSEGAPGDDLSFGISRWLEWRGLICRGAGHVSRVENFSEGLVVFAGVFGDDDVVDEDSGHADVFRIVDAIDDSFHLGNDDAAVVAGGLGDR